MLLGGGQVYKLYCTDDGGVAADADAVSGAEEGQAQTVSTTVVEAADTVHGNGIITLGNEQGWMLVFRRVSRATDRRAFIFTVLPTTVAANDKSQLIFPACDSHLGACLLAIFNSLVLEFIGHFKQSATNLGLFILWQLPVLPPEAFTPQDVAFICERVAKLTRTSDDINAVWLTDYPSYSFQEPKERLRIRAELDAYIARMYDLTRDELRYILDPKELMGA